jgi:hypothetical protein
LAVPDLRGFSENNVKALPVSMTQNVTVASPKRSTLALYVVAVAPPQQQADYSRASVCQHTS